MCYLLLEAFTVFPGIDDCMNRLDEFLVRCLSFFAVFDVFDDFHCFNGLSGFYHLVGSVGFSSRSWCFLVLIL